VTSFKYTNQTKIMLRLAITFLVIALIAGALGLGGVSGIAMNLAYVIGAIGLILFVVHLVTGKRVS
jgi:uncharacterized membrane protein YtjA (UPF0391 family)